MYDGIEIRTITVAEATERLRAMGMKISPEIVRDGIEQRRFPFGDVIRTKSGSPRCYVYEKSLMEWASEKGIKNG